MDNDELTPKDGVRDSHDDANDAKSTYDSREKIEAEVRYEYNGPIENEAEQIIGWLDRQAAITERECEESKGRLIETASTYCKQYRAKIDELTSERGTLMTALKQSQEDCQMWLDQFDAENAAHVETRKELNECAKVRDKAIAELQADLETAHAKNRALKAHISDMQNGRHGWHVKAKDLQAKVDELTAERDKLKRKLESSITANEDYRDEWHRVCAERANLARDLSECMADRDRYRELVGQMLDAAHEIRRIADANMPEGAVV